MAEGFRLLRSGLVPEGLSALAQFLAQAAAETGNHSMAFQRDFQAVVSQVNQMAMRILEDNPEVGLHMLLWAE